MLGYIITFCILLLVYLLHLLKKRKDNPLIIVLTTLYLLSAVVSIFNYEAKPEAYKELNIFSYIFLFVSVVVAFTPLLGFYPRKYIGVKVINISAANSIAIILIILFFPKTISAIPSIIEDFNKIMLDFSYASEMYADTAENVMSQSGNNIANIWSILRTSFSEVIVFYPFYYLLYSKRNKFITILLWLSSLSPLLISFSLASRTIMSWWIMEMLICYIIFRKYYGDSVKKGIDKVIVFFITIVVLSFGAFTVGRFATGMYANDSYVGGSLVSYSGQGTLNFSDDVLQNDVYQYGDNCFPLFRRMIGLEASSNLYERQLTWSTSMKIRQGAFYTFIGDFYNDFSPIFGFFILTIVSLFLYGIVSRSDGNQIKGQKLYFIYFCSCVFYNGLFYFSYKGTGGNLRIIVNLLFIVLFVFLSSKNKFKNA